MKCSKKLLSAITNVDIRGDAWIQATLPVRHGGLSLRRLSALALPCYLSSLISCSELICKINPSLHVEHTTSLLGSAVADFRILTGLEEIPLGDMAGSQRAWDDKVCQSEYNSHLAEADQVERARLLAAREPYSAAWLGAIPNPNLGLHLDAEAVRIAVGLRLGTPLCVSHRCRCGTLVGNLGLHGLSCQRSAGRLPRHANLNDVVKRALAVAGVPSWLEPLGLDRGDGRRPDGLTVFPYSGGKSLCWDSTCVDTYCRSSIISCALNPGSAAKAAEEKKRAKYSELSVRFRFEPVAVETSGVIGPSTLKFLIELGQRMRQHTGERREGLWLLQRISFAIVRGNAASVAATGNLY